MGGLQIGKSPEERAGSPGALLPREGQIVIFATMDELRVFGPIALREWLKRNRPPGRALRRVGDVVEFRGAHQEALDFPSSSSPVGSR